jgi:hypothetical protein
MKRRTEGVLLALVLVVGGGNLWASWLEVHSAQAAQRREVAAQRQQGRVTERKLCTTMQRLAALKPPPGSAAANPSRAYDQSLHATLDQLGPDLGCGTLKA